MHAELMIRTEENGKPYTRHIPPPDFVPLARFDADYVALRNSCVAEAAAIAERHEKEAVQGTKETRHNYVFMRRYTAEMERLVGEKLARAAKAT